jgi:Mrp family chromosome partitioning ATPase
VVRLPDDAETKLGVPLLGVGPLLHAGETPAEAVDNAKMSLTEAHHAIRAALALSSAAGLPRTVLVMSSRPIEGKSTTSWAIARDIAQGGRRTLLIDADMGKPSLHRTLGVPNKLGLSNLLADHDDVAEAIVTTKSENLSFLPSGSASA